MNLIQNGKATLTPSANGLSITVPSRKQWFAMLFIPVWLVGWAIGFTFAGSQVMQGMGGGGSVDAFLTVWLVGWTLGGLFAIGIGLWLWFGKEEFRVSGSRVIFERGVFGLGLRSELDRSQIRNVRYQQVDSSFSGSRQNLSAFGLGEGRIKFDYGMKTYSFGLGVDEAEAHYLVERIEAVL